MLLQLKIHNIALIDDLTIDFTEGMNCLTGETGAGKSIIIDSIECVLGGRTYKDIIKTGCESAYVDALFCYESDKISAFLEEIGIPTEPDNSIVIHRDMNVSGRNVCRINGSMSTISILKKLGNMLLDIHGQNDNQSLLNSDNHIKLLDLFCGQELNQYKQQYQDKIKELSQCENKLKALSGSPDERTRMIDLYTYQLEEIDKAKLIAGEDEELIEKRTMLLNYEKIVANLSGAYEILNGGGYSDISIREMLDRCINCFSQISVFSEKYSNIYDNLENIKYSLDDIAIDIRRENENSFYDKNELESINSRLDLLNNLKRKYNKSIEEIIEFSGELQNKIDELKSSEYLVDQILLDMDRICSEMYDICEDMNFARVKAAGTIEKAICTELCDVELKNAKFKIDIVFNTEKNNDGRYCFTQNGLDSVQFLVSTNAGEPVKPLAKVASGGEMSRIMLAIKTILADFDEIPTLIFDEIDTGISGVVTNRVAQKLKHISQKHQVLCVTHHASIAACADNNILITKITKDDRTLTSIEQLDKNGKICEIARLLDGDSQSEIALLHAKNLIERLS